MGNINPCRLTVLQYRASTQMIGPLVDLVFNQSEYFSIEIHLEQQNIKKKLKKILLRSLLILLVTDQSINS